MTRKMMASVLALSLALTSAGSVPARAGSGDEVGRFIAGAVTLFIIGKALEQSIQRKSPSVSQAPIKVPPVFQAPARNQSNFRGYLPNECFFKVKTASGRRGVYGKTCLQTVMYRPQRLPRVCLDTVRVRYGRPADVYDAKCLRQRGFRDEAWQG